MFTPKSIAVVSLWAEDVSQATHFYRDVLKLPALPHHGEQRPHFRVGETILTILEGTPAVRQPNDPGYFPAFAIAVDDLDAALAQLQHHNFPLVGEVVEGCQCLCGLNIKIDIHVVATHRNNSLLCCLLLRC